VGTLDTHVVSVDWGDGTTNGASSLAAGATSFSIGHVYGAEGAFAVTVTVSDDDAGQASGATSVTVTAAAPTAPAAPSGLNAIVTSTRAGKTRVYSGSLTWVDNSNNETAFIVQRFVKSKKSCVLDTGFGTKLVTADVTSYIDPTATASTCGYQVAARNGVGDSGFVKDLNVAGGVTP
jgi:hypothetical protein